MLIQGTCSDIHMGYQVSDVAYSVSLVLDYYRSMLGHNR
jgi:hypothetical protein